MDEFRVKPAREQANCSALSSGPGRLPQCREQFEMHGTKTGLKTAALPPSLSSWRQLGIVSSQVFCKLSIAVLFMVFSRLIGINFRVFI
jgi:hypothetical protein